MMIIFGVFPNASNAEILLNNLSEADFDLSDVSVVMRTSKQRNAFAQDCGPLKGATMSNLSEKLLRSGLPTEACDLYRDALLDGKVLVAMNVTPETKAAAKEMFEDHSAELIKE